VVLPRLAEAARQAGGAGDNEALDALLHELLQTGVVNRSEIAYAAIVSGYYDDPVILECVRELLVTDSDLKDITGALMPAGAEPTVEQLRAVAGALRNVVLRHARYRCGECGLDSSTFLWQCPGCKTWDSLRAVAALEFLPRAARPT
jgi:lipopolysaccharide biosynthesis regulator YciM